MNLEGDTVHTVTRVQGSPASRQPAREPVPGCPGAESAFSQDAQAMAVRARAKAWEEVRPPGARPLGWA